MNNERGVNFICNNRLLSRVCTLPVYLRDLLMGVASFKGDKKKRACAAYISSQRALDAAKMSHKQRKAPEALYKENIANKTAIFRAGRT